MRRILSFIVGISLGLTIAYLIRRQLKGSNNSTTTAYAPNLEQSETKSVEKPIAITGRYPVRTSGPRPQAPVVPEVEEPTLTSKDIEEPIAAQETDTTATSSRAEMETQEELATASDMLPQVMATPDTTADTDTGDDFVTIRGIGHVTAQKLKAAGVISFSQLAELSLDQWEQITEFTEARVKRDKLVEQAEALAKGEEYHFQEEAVD